MLTGNKIAEIMTRGDTKLTAYEIVSLSLSETSVAAWSDIHALRDWFPQLQSLNISDTPLLNGAVDCGEIFSVLRTPRLA